MKIAFIINDITNSAGTERVVVNLCNYFISRNMEVDIHSLTSKERTSFFPLDRNVFIHHYGLSSYSNESNRWRKIYLKIVSTFRNIRHFRKIDADIVLGTGKHINIYLTIFNRKKTMVKIGCEHFSHNAPMSLPVKLLRRWCYPSLARLVVLNRLDYSYYSSFMNGVELIPNFVVLEVESPSTLKHKTVLAIGRHNQEKGFDILLKVWQRVQQKHPDWRLCIVGDGPLLEENKRLAEKLKIKGSVLFEPPTNDVASKYLSASVYVMTSRSESFGMVLLEAMKCGLPCVSFDCDAGPRDIIVDGVTGYLVSVNDLDGMAESIDGLITNPELREKMGAEALMYVKRFSLEHIGQQWIELFATTSKA